MGNGTNSRKRNSQKLKDFIPKPKNKETFTHTEFIDFIEPFFEPLKEKHAELLKTEVQPKSFKFKKEIYLKWIEQFKDKYASCFIFDQDVDFERICFDKPLILTQNIKKQFSDKTAFAEENEILENYRLGGYSHLLNEYRDQVHRNNMRRKEILLVLEERARYFSYYRAFDLIRKELEDIQRKRIHLKKKKRDEMETATIKEYLNRLDEFFNAFGTPSQFDDIEFSDIF